MTQFVKVEMREGRKLISSLKVGLDDIIKSIAIKFDGEKALLAKKTLEDGVSYKFKLKGKNFNVKPLYTPVN